LQGFSPKKCKACSGTNGVPEQAYWLLANNSKRKMAIFQDMYSLQGIGIIDKEILDIASETKVKLQNEGIVIGDDVLIAAYCIKHNLVLVTNNTKHFKDIENLRTVNWKD